MVPSNSYYLIIIIHLLPNGAIASQLLLVNLVCASAHIPKAVVPSAMLCEVKVNFVKQLFHVLILHFIFL